MRFFWFTSLVTHDQKKDAIRCVSQNRHETNGSVGSIGRPYVFVANNRNPTLSPEFPSEDKEAIWTTILLFLLLPLGIFLSLPFSLLPFLDLNGIVFHYEIVAFVQEPGSLRQLGIPIFV